MKNMDTLKTLVYIGKLIACNRNRSINWNVYEPDGSNGLDEIRDAGFVAVSRGWVELTNKGWRKFHEVKADY